MPAKVWDGNWADKSEETQTTIYVFPLCSAIEKAIDSVILQYKNGKINCEIIDMEEIKSRFTVLQ